MILHKISITVSSDGVFTMTVGGVSNDSTTDKTKTSTTSVNEPSPRMKPGIAICKGTIYLYGGEFESGSKQYTLNDFYSLGEQLDNIFAVLVLNLKL